MIPLKSGGRPRVCFLFIAQRHQILHAAPTAVALSRYGAFDVHVAGATDEHLEDVRRLEHAMGGARLAYRRLWFDSRVLMGPGAIPPKALTLALNLGFLRRFDAIVTPERTSLLLRKMGLRHPLLIHTDHGAGDRAVGYEPRIGKFDFTLVAGEKQRRRMRAAGLIREGRFAVVGYPKFDAVDALGSPAPVRFQSARPTVLYNPHFDPALSSWPRFGLQVLEAFAAQSTYNLIFAPHIRLFDGVDAPTRARLEAFRSPQIHVDLGSRASADMSYTRAADVYLGDVSSQVYEFVRDPRPCLFLNPRGVRWASDENYAHWSLGPVFDSAHEMVTAVDAAVASHRAYEGLQRRAFADTFDLDGSSSERAAGAVSAFLTARLSAKTRSASAPLPSGGLVGGER